MYIKTNTILDKILAQKEAELRDAMHSLAWVARVMYDAEEAEPAREFAAALQRETVALIAEVKKASPSRGIIVQDFDPVQIGTAYDANGAAAISVLTDEQFFQGHLRYMKEVHEAVSVPILRKDFIIDDFQVYEGRAAGADAILLIVAALEDAQMADLYATITGLGMTALVEVHDEGELDRALELNPVVVGINNRDLKTFDVDLETTARLSVLVPDDVILVAESGIRSVEDVAYMGALGAHAVLVGEHLVQSVELVQAVQAFSNQRRLPRTKGIQDRW